jgi:hypothetical protein
MELSRLFIVDPKTNERSVSLTLMLCSFIIAVVAASLDMAGVVKSTSVSLELFWGTSALYFGRKWSARGQEIDLKDKE